VQLVLVDLSHFLLVVGLFHELAERFTELLKGDGVAPVFVADTEHLLGEVLLEGEELRVSEALFDFTVHQTIVYPRRKA
jgi:hypothetical protein